MGMVSALAVIMIMAGCIGPKNIEGKYVNELDPDKYLELDKDGTFFLRTAKPTKWDPTGSSVSGKYTLEGNVITLYSKEYGGSAWSQGEIKGDTIEMGSGLYKKQK